MKQVMLCLGIFLAFALPCAAQKASGPFADVPLHTWPYAAVQTLAEAGVAIGYPDGTYGGRREMTRYEFTVAVARLLAQLPQSTADPQNEPGHRLQKAPLALNAFLALAEEFAPELDKLTQSDSKATERFPDTLALIRGWKQQAWRDVWNGKIVLTAEQLQNPFAEVPHTAAALRDADDVQKAGIVLGEPNDSNIGPRPRLTRLQMAQAIIRVIFSKDDMVPDLSKRLQQSPVAARALNALSAEFPSELKLLGVDMTVYHQRLAELTGRQTLPLIDHFFTDVPANHWAAAAVETLRLHGIITGYPGGNYTTQ